MPYFIVCPTRRNRLAEAIYDSVAAIHLTSCFGIQLNVSALEMKTVAGKSISFERTKEEKGEIHFHQIAGLNEWNEYDGIICGFVIEFRKIETTVFIEISEFNKLINAIPKKSFNYDDLEKYGVQYVIIEQQMARTRYTYNMDKFLQDCNI